MRQITSASICLIGFTGFLYGPNSGGLIHSAEEGSLEDHSCASFSELDPWADMFSSGQGGGGESCHSRGPLISKVRCSHGSGVCRAQGGLPLFSSGFPLKPPQKAVLKNRHQRNQLHRVARPPRSFEPTLLSTHTRMGPSLFSRDALQTRPSTVFFHFFLGSCLAGGARRERRAGRGFGAGHCWRGHRPLRGCAGKGDKGCDVCFLFFVGGPHSVLLFVCGCSIGGVVGF